MRYLFNYNVCRTLFLFIQLCNDMGLVLATWYISMAALQIILTLSLPQPADSVVFYLKC